MATLTELQEELAELKATEKSVRVGGQSLGSKTRSITRVDYSALQGEIRRLENRIACHPDNGGLKGSQVVFRG